MESEILNDLGLTDNEIKVYLAVLKLGRCSGTEIRKNTQISNSQVYSSLDSLIYKGLIIYEKTSVGKKYFTSDPIIITDLMAKRNKTLQDYVTYLQKLRNNSNYLADISVYEGLNGFKSAMINLANECPKNETISIIGFSNQNYKNEKLSVILTDVNKISIQKKHKFKMILDNKENTFFAERKEEKISKIKFMGRNFKSPAAIDIFQDKVYILIWDENPYAIRIKNRNVAEGFKIYFDFLWNMANF